MRTKYIVTLVVAAVLCSVVVAGTFYAYWMGVNSSPKANIEVKVVYVYIGHQNVTDTEGLTYSTSPTNQDYNHYNLDSYVIILKVTNNGAQMISMTEFRAWVAQQITENKVGLTDTKGNPAPGGLGGPSFGISNAVIDDERAGLSTPDFSNYLDAGSSRLIALTGVISIQSYMGQFLQNGTAYIMGSVTAQTGYASGLNVLTPQSQSADDIEKITFQTMGNGDYLYNNLLFSGQSLIINQLDAEVNSKT